MKFLDKLSGIRNQLAQQKIDGWLLYDYRGSNPLVYSVLEISLQTFCSRRFFYWIPAQGDPLKIVPSIEPHTLDHLPGDKQLYKTWQELEILLSKIAKKNSSIAMEYSPNNSLPAISKVDAGTIDLIRSYGATVVSSANLLQQYTSVWSENQWNSHQKAAEVLETTVELTWNYISQCMTSKKQINEWDVQCFMLREIEKNGCIADHPPICAVNENSANPHYEAQEKTAKLIKSGDFVLIDLWCKKNTPNAVYADIARVGAISEKPTKRQQDIFDLVKRARNKATAFINEHYSKKMVIKGYEVDDVCRQVITEAGYGDFFIHRTGHNIGEMVHGSGTNIDNYETHDFRELIPGTCFSIEPGIYLPNEFGVRLEYDVYLDPSGKIKITGGIQEEIALIK